jgi:hypothetical protein
MKTTTPETWQRIREDYINGLGTMTALAHKYGLLRQTVQARAAKEKWTELRRQANANKLSALVQGSAMPPALVPAVTPSQEILSRHWIEEKQAAHYIEGMAIVELARAEFKRRFAAPEKITNGDLAKLTTGLNNLVEVETRLLGIPDRRKDKPEKPKSKSMEVEPLVPTPEMIAETEREERERQHQAGDGND